MSSKSWVFPTWACIRSQNTTPTPQRQTQQEADYGAQRKLLPHHLHRRHNLRKSPSVQQCSARFKFSSGVSFETLTARMTGRGFQKLYCRALHTMPRITQTHSGGTIFARRRARGRGRVRRGGLGGAAAVAAGVAEETGHCTQRGAFQSQIARKSLRCG